MSPSAVRAGIAGAITAFANPVHALARAITAFTEQRLPSNGSPRSSYNFGVIEGGSSINSIPTMARTKVDIRSESAIKLDEIAALLTSAVERALETENERATGGKVTAKIKEIGSRPGGRFADDAYILQAVRAVDSHLGIRSHLDCASTDANIPLSLGLPAISIGAGGHGGGAHTPQEWFHPDGRELGLKRVLLTVVPAAPRLGRRMTIGPPAADRASRELEVDGSLVAVALIWGATFVLVKQALADVSTLLFLTLRFSIAAVALAWCFARNSARPKPVASLGRGVIAGVFLFGGYVLQTAGLQFTSASKAGFITGMYVPLVPIIGGLAAAKAAADLGAGRHRDRLRGHGSADGAEGHLRYRTAAICWCWAARWPTRVTF